MTQSIESKQGLTAEEWFGGGQDAELQRIGTLKDAVLRKAALQQFNALNNAFLEERALQERPGVTEKAKSHPAVDAAIDETIDREKGWIKDIAGWTDDQLRNRYLGRAFRQDASRNRVDPGLSLDEYKALRPEITEIAEKFTRGELERKEILSRMIQDRGFTVAKCKVAYERKQNPELVAVAEKNLAHRRLPAARYNDVLFAEVSQVKKTLANAKATGLKL